MIKKSLILIVALLPLMLKAQQGMGSWEIFSAYANADKIIETPEKMYVLSSGSLSSYDMNTNENFSYGINNLLSEPTVTGIYYNKYAKFLAVTYASGNIDILYDNGKKRNVSDIKDAVLTTDRIINDIDFAPGYMAVATSFGLVLFDTDKMIVKQSGIYNKPVLKAAVTDTHVAAVLNNKESNTILDICYIPLSGRINLLDNFQTVTRSANMVELVGLKGTDFYVSYANSTFQMRIDPDANTYSDVTSTSLSGIKKGLGVSKNGYYAYNGNTLRHFIYDEATRQMTYTDKAIPASLQGKFLAMWDDPDTVWAADATGVSRNSMADGNAYISKYRPGKITFTRVGYITVAPSGRIYIQPRGFSQAYKSYGWTENTQPLVLNVIDTDGTIRDVTPTNLTVTRNHVNGVPKDSYRIAEDPNNPDVIYIPTRYEGLYKYDIGSMTELAKFNQNNSGLTNTYGYNCIYNAYLDKQANLWVANQSKDNAFFKMIRATDLNSGNTTVEYWKPIYAQGGPLNIGNTDTDFVIVGNSGFECHMYSQGIYFFDISNGIDNVTVKHQGRFIDQDGKEINFADNNVFCFNVDKKNNTVWFGSTLGPFIIPNASEAGKSSTEVRVQRIKVPRNDGTNYADYLLDGVWITCIASDGINRKWIGTNDDGVYLVSEDGSQILEHFTTENSGLPTNQIFDIACDPNSNAVYFGTLMGLVKYNSNAAPAAADYSDVYAYPNPVRPDYHGWITVTGLMDNSRVKIMDAQQHVYFDGQSQGGMLIWDGCDANGNRVKTGVYYVYASQHGDSNANVVTKILVVK